MVLLFYFKITGTTTYEYNMFEFSWIKYYAKHNIIWNINHWIVYLLDVHSYPIKSEKIILYSFSELSSSSIANFLIIILGDSLIIPIAFFVSLIINSFSKTDLFRIFNYTYLKTTFSKYCEFFNYSKCVHYRVFILWNVWSIEIKIRY